MEYYPAVLATAHIEVDPRTIQLFTEFLRDEGVVVPDSQLAQTIKDVIRDMVSPRETLRLNGDRRKAGHVAQAEAADEFLVMSNLWQGRNDGAYSRNCEVAMSVEKRWDPGDDVVAPRLCKVWRFLPCEDGDLEDPRHEG
ncbi:Protein of unknown function [Pyronema omphalodes CBS 100304]|uniref:Uncharacterized protein n=1 Tax=Pyronema omphalodes (strain CBS 100304) TaxID=1076935 RepID=U4L9D6_PYROM|nr:Protein of unknown function [Pyronema omphalodes CBS 100304]